MNLRLVHEFDSPGSVDLKCSDGGSGVVEAFSTKITAVEVANLSNVGF